MIKRIPCRVVATNALSDKRADSNRCKVGEIVAAAFGGRQFVDSVIYTGRLGISEAAFYDEPLGQILDCCA